MTRVDTPGVERAARAAIRELLFLAATMAERVSAARALARACGLEWPPGHTIGDTEGEKHGNEDHTNVHEARVHEANEGCAE